MRLSLYVGRHISRNSPPIRGVTTKSATSLLTISIARGTLNTQPTIYLRYGTWRLNFYVTFHSFNCDAAALHVGRLILSVGELRYIRYLARQLKRYVSSRSFDCHAAALHVGRLILSVDEPPPLCAVTSGAPRHQSCYRLFWSCFTLKGALLNKTLVQTSRTSDLKMIAYSPSFYLSNLQFFV